MRLTRLIMPVQRLRGNDNIIKEEVMMCVVNVKAAAGLLLAGMCIGSTVSAEPYSATYNEFNPVYYREPGFTIRNIQGDSCEVVNPRSTAQIGSETISGSKKARYDAELAAAYDDTDTTVTVLQDSESEDSLVLSLLEKNHESVRLDKPFPIRKLVAEFYRDGDLYNYDRTVKNGKESYTETSSTDISRYDKRQFSPEAALKVPEGEPNGEDNGLPYYVRDNRTYYVNAERTHVVKVVTRVNERSRVEKVYADFVPVGDAKLPTFMEKTRFTNGEPVTRFRQYNIRYSDSVVGSRLDTLMTQAKNRNAFGGMTELLN